MESTINETRKKKATLQGSENRERENSNQAESSQNQQTEANPGGGGGGGGLAAAFDLAAYEGYMIARGKKLSIIQESYRACAKQVFHFCFGVILDFLIHERTENVYKVAT